MKIVTVVGARPQFIKAAVVSHVLRVNNKEVLIHTGQHYDYNMSERFFEELDIPKPDYNLGISGGTHAEMTGKMMISLEQVLMKEKPDWLLLYGDTNSTLAGALAAAKLHIPVCHVEAGTRTHSMTNPEEINRVCVDHVSSLLLASTRSSLEELKHEGIEDNAIFVGDPMYDAFLKYSNRLAIDNVDIVDFDSNVIPIPKEYYYLTCHREENTKDDKTLFEILCAMNSLNKPTIYPVHPRNKERVNRLRNENRFDNIIFSQPVGYLESLSLLLHSEKIVTDSGGLQREAFFAKKKCVTILDFVVWPETMIDGRNVLSKPLFKDIVAKLDEKQTIHDSYDPFGDGHSSEKIVESLEHFH